MILAVKNLIHLCLMISTLIGNRSVIAAGTQGENST